MGNTEQMILSKQEEIRMLEEKLSEAKKGLKQYERYRGLRFDKYREYSNGKYKYYDGLAKENFTNALRTLTMLVFGVKLEGKRLSIKSQKISELDCEKTKLCNDFIDELYPIIAKYVDIVLQNEEA